MVSLEISEVAGVCKKVYRRKSKVGQRVVHYQDLWVLWGFEWTNGSGQPDVLVRFLRFEVSER